MDTSTLEREGYIFKTTVFNNVPDEEAAATTAFIKHETFGPGAIVKVHTDLLKNVIQQRRIVKLETEVLESLLNVSDKLLQIQNVIFYGAKDVRFTLIGSDVEFERFYFIDPRPTITIYGGIVETNGRLYAVALDSFSSDNVIASEVYEIAGGVEPSFGYYFDIKNEDDLRTLIQNPELETKVPGILTGAFNVSDIGFGTWALSWSHGFSGSSSKELEAALEAVQKHLENTPRPN